MSELIDTHANTIQAAIVGAEAAAPGIEDEALRTDVTATLASLHAYALELFNGLKVRHPELTDGVALRSGPVEK